MLWIEIVKKVATYLLVGALLAGPPAGDKLYINGRAYTVVSVTPNDGKLAVPSDTWGTFEDLGLRLLYAHRDAAGVVLYELTSGDEVIVYLDGQLDVYAVDSCTIEPLRGEESPGAFFSHEHLLLKYGEGLILQTCHDPTRKEVLYGDEWLCCVPTSVLICQLNGE